jgi:radical SAM superfamily enzyme YgiQ (UPF0313 family)
MDYVGSIYRPPSEASSLLLQVTVGCSHNRCSFCSMYREKRFSTKPFETVRADLQEAAAVGPVFDRVFLCDGDALVLSTERLLRILRAIRELLPWVKRVGTYGDSRNVLGKSPEELRELREAGLGIVYHGVESGDDETLARIDKGGTAADCVETARRLREAGIRHSAIVLLGIGGVARSREHAAATARLLTAMDPPYVGALTTTVLPGTPLHEEERAGRFVLPDRFAILEELRTLVAESRFTNTRFSANHASNHLPITGRLPRDREAILAVLDRTLAIRDERLLRPEWMRGL